MHGWEGTRKPSLWRISGVRAGTHPLSKALEKKTEKYQIGESVHGNEDQINHYVLNG